MLLVHALRTAGLAPATLQCCKCKHSLRDHAKHVTSVTRPFLSLRGTQPKKHAVLSAKLITSAAGESVDKHTTLLHCRAYDT